jgi:cobalt-zinc-cadmium resistance protein CzcA
VPLERALNGTQRMIQLRSESLFGLSLVTLTFDDDADPFTSRMIVGQRMMEADLPDGITPRLSPEATPLGEVYQFRVVSDRHDLYQLRAELQYTITRVLKQVPGVADVVSFGGYLKEIHVRPTSATRSPRRTSTSAAVSCAAATRSSRCAASATSPRSTISAASC